MKSKNSVGIIGLGIATIVMLAVALAVFSTPAMAGTDPCICGSPYNYEPCPCRCSVSGTVNGDVFVLGGQTDTSQQHSYDPNHQTEEFYVTGNENGTVKWARLYNHVWGGSPPKYGGANMTFCNANGDCWDTHPNEGIFCPRMDVPEYPNNCEQTQTKGFYQCGYGTHWLYWNVTEYVTAGYNNATIHTNDYGEKPGGGYTWDGRVMWMVLVVVFEDTSKPAIRYWVDQGLSKPAYPDIPEALFTGSINTANHTLWQLAMLCDDPISIDFNACELDSYPEGTDDLTKHAVPASCINDPGNNKMIWDHGLGSMFPALAVLAEQEPEFFPDLKVMEKKIDHLGGSCSGQTPTGFVVSHTYDVRAKIKNDGDASTSSSFSVTLYDNETVVQTNTMDPLVEGESGWTTFPWTPTTSGPHTLRVFADSTNAIFEDTEENNNKTQTETVLAAVGQPDLIPALDFLPAWQQSSKTDIIVTVSNDGQTDAGAAGNEFFVNATLKNTTTGSTLWTGSSTTFVCAKANRELTFTPDTELTRCHDYTVTVELDPTNAVSESNEGNNAESKTFHAVEVELKVTHHFGNWSDYAGQLSGYNTATMFETTKTVTNYTTPEKLLTSEADVTSGTNNPPFVWGINRSVNEGTSTWYMNQSWKETETCIPGKEIWWFCYVNGIGFKSMPDLMDDYYFGDGEKMQMDILKYVNAGNITTHFRPRSVMTYPEPFKHGFNGVVWDTTVVYPHDVPGYAALANTIRDNLLSAGVANVNVRTNATLAPAEKTGNHLILLGTPLQNHVIEEINANHAEAGMPVYFDLSDAPNITMIDDWLNDCQPATFDCGGVVEACDNPFNNAEPWTDAWDGESQTIWIASGVGDKEAKNAAELLANHTDRFNKKFFWGYTINVTIYEGKNLIATPFEMDEETGTNTLDWVFEDNPANGDKVYRYLQPGGIPVSVTYIGGTWYPIVNQVEPIEPEVGYEYDRAVGAGDFNLILGCRLPYGTVSTPIYEGKNLIGYACLNKTTLSTFNAPVNGDKVYRYLQPGGIPVSVTYIGGTWYPIVNQVEPIEPGVGYEYDRAGILYYWTYSC